MKDICLIAGSVLLFAAVLVSALSIIGIYKFRFIMNRMHAAAVVDTLGLLLLILGLILVSRDMAFIPKLLLILVVQWIGSPLASHLVGKLEIRTDASAPEHMAEEHFESEEKEACS